MSSRLKRIVRKHVPGERQALRRLARLGEKLKQAKALRKAFPNDPKVITACDAFEESMKEMLAAGYTIREGGGEVTVQKRWPLPPEWDGKEPPEKP
jgi:hypothetical protein